MDHKLTWYSRDGKTANLIVYVIVNWRLAGSIQDTRVYNSAVIDAKSKDHHLVVSKANLKLKFPQRPALYAKVWLILSTLLFKTVKPFNVKSAAMRREQPLSYTEEFLFVSSYNVALYFQLKELAFLFSFWTFLNWCMFWFWLFPR